MEIVGLWLKLMITVIISTAVFLKVFSTINKSMLKLFIPIQKFINRLKRKGMYSGIIFIGTIMVISLINDKYNLSYISYGILFGLANALICICFYG
ncbi:hypothetical protein [Clostridium fungisolvens]|uniref:Uncharacterized protein n=1 Tax=Clostridium fungisolvens TaxID=1604897 RepID=A0A6V8SLH1_9CLOT|nr:hypothetical protein [Clostridium fungisolvens]GFP78027.1 hypothetical protein bsdtw1_04219 [Clostridium fungisolvens]